MTWDLLRGVGAGLTPALHLALVAGCAVFALAFLRSLLHVAFHRPGGESGGGEAVPAPFCSRDPHVIDGDTLDAGGVRIRLRGIDAPEADQPGGREATAALREIVRGYRVHYMPLERDVYGRVVAQVHAGGRDAGLAMLRGGYAIATDPGIAAYVHAQKDARRARAGLWGQGGIGDPKAWRTAKG